MLKYHPDLVWKDIDTLIPYVRNTKKHPDAQVDKIAGSIAEFGFDQPIVIDGENVIIKGHGRYLASKKLKLSEVPVLVRTDLSASQVKAARIADNRTAQSEWDEDLLKLEFIDLQDMNFDLAMTGFEIKEIEGFLKEEPTTHEVDDEAPSELDELVDEFGTAVGQVWKIGPHRLAIGDSTDASFVQSFLGHQQPQVLFTSPPYWIGLEYEQETAWNEVLSFMERFASIYSRSIAPNGRIIINTGMCPGKALTGAPAHSKLLIDEWQRAFEKQEWLLRYARFWIKSGGIYHTNPDFDCIDNHSEFLGYFYHPKAKFRGMERLDQPWCGMGYWDDIPGKAKEEGHVAAFPIELVARNIQLFTRPQEVVLDTFSGSGTTLLACQQLNRIGWGIEIDPGYAALSLRRLKREYPDLPQALE